MARTNVPLSPLVPNGQLDDPAGTAGDDVNGHVVTGAELEEIVLRVVNGVTAVEITILAGDNPPADRAGQGNLVETVADGATEFLGPFTSARFKQKGDATDAAGLWFDLDNDANVTITAFHVPRTA